MEHWTEYKLGELLEKIIGGGTPSKRNLDYWGGKIPWASVKDMKDGVFSLSATIDHITEEGLQNSSANLIPAGTVIISTRMGLGRCFINKVDMAINQDLKALVPTEELDNDYLLWLMASKAEEIQALGTGTTVKGIRLEALRALKVKLPELFVQKEISGVLSAYNHLIENNNRRIVILETIAQNLYREWFINFRFPGHDQSSGQTIGITKGCLEGASAKDGASKQAQWQETPQGKIPLGWEIKAASEVVEFAPRMKLPKEGFKPFVSMPNVSEDSMLIDEIEWREGNSGTKFQNGDTLLARITPCLQNGKTAFVQFLDEEHPIGFGSTEFIVMRSKGLTPEFVYCLARSEQFRGHAINSMAGADGRQRVRNDCFDSYYLAVPPKELLESFEKLAKPLFEQIFTLSKNNKNLRQQRDLLLPKLIK